MATNVAALQSAIKLVTDAVKDVVAVIAPGQSVLAKLMQCENLIEDLTVLIPQAGQIPAEVKALAPSDAVALVDGLVVDLGISNVHAEGIVNASLKLLTDLATVIILDVEALISAIKAPAGVAVPAPAAS